MSIFRSDRRGELDMVIHVHDGCIRLEIPPEPFAVHDDPRAFAKHCSLGIDVRGSTVIVHRTIDDRRSPRYLLHELKRWGAFEDEHNATIGDLSRSMRNPAVII